MSGGLPLGVLLAAARRFQAVWEQLRWSWEHHDTLKYLAFGAVVLFIMWLGHRREWNGALVGMLGFVGGAAVLTAAGIAVLGDWARRTGPVSARTVAREVRASNGGPISDVPDGSVCKTSLDCHRSSLCVRLKGDDYWRCEPRCDEDRACPDGSVCTKARGGRVCLTQPPDQGRGL